MVSKLMLWGGRHGVFQQPILCGALQCNTSASRSRHHFKYRDLSRREKEILVAGYLRKYTRKYFRTRHSPPELVSICFLFYNVVMDEWDTRHSSVYLQFYEKDTTLHCHSNASHADHWKNAFGCIVVGKHQKHKWKLRLSHASSYYSVRIGVVDVEHVYHSDLLKDTLQQSALDRVSNKAFVMSCFTGYFWHKSIGKRYGKQCKENAIVEMELDLLHKRRGGRLRYIVNGEDFGYATQNIDCSKQYVLAVSLVNDEQITILKS